MKTNEFKTRKLLPVLLTLAVIASTFMFLNTRSIQTKLDKEQVKSENLLSEKLKLDKTIANFQRDVSDLLGKNKMLDNMIAESNLKLLKKTQEAEKLLKQNAAIPDLKKKVSELENLKKQLLDEISDANTIVSQLRNQNKELSYELEQAHNLNESITEDNQLLKALNSDNYRTEALKGKNDKLTVNARRTDKLMVSFDIPSNVGENINFKIVTPEGNELSSLKDFEAQVSFKENGDALVAGSADFMGGTGTKRIEMTYNPAKKLTKGVYLVTIYNEGKILGNTQLRLR